MDSPLTNSVNHLLKQGYRCQLVTPDLAVLAKPNPNNHYLSIITVSGDGTVETKPLSEFLESILNG